MTQRLQAVRRLALSGCLLLAACAGSGSSPTGTQPPVTTAEPSLPASASPTPSSSPTSLLTPTPSPAATPDIYAAQLAASGLPTTIAGHVVTFSYSVGLPTTWVITGVVKVLGLTINDVYLAVDAGDSTDPLNLRTFSIVAYGYHGAQAAALLDAFVTAAKSSPTSVCPKCAFIRTTVAGKRIVIEDGMPTTRQPDGKLAWPGGRQYAYAHGDVLYGIRATTPAILAEVLAALP